MYLKSIEVQGFKSFANKIKFEFHNGITGIVGPNGSGKSNVADAVRWVLGEQRVKQLRGGNMQDVIFSGTENRKPLSYASVAITLDNSDHKLPVDYEEVTVARKLYRSGESEYLINGRACRLKDVNELFYDTGIGKEGYSIIGQGQIDKILSGKPDERRELFDEAAGIVKFKRRKSMSVKKLEDERQNLVRVNDILSELEKQVEKVRPKLIVAGASAYPRAIDFEKIAEIAHGYGAYLMVDMAHIAGLVAGGYHQSPVPYADVVTTTTHKTLRGPRGGLILTNNPILAKRINSAVFPGTQGGPLEHVIAAKAVCFGEALKPEFKEYARKIVENAQALAAALQQRGVKLVSGGTDNHLMLIDLRDEECTGKDLEQRLDSVHITANKNTVPGETRSPFVTSGVRLGTPAVTTRGMGAAEMQVIADCIADCIWH